jgi:acyl-CoA carboxylase subunit alpha
VHTAPDLADAVASASREAAAAFGDGTVFLERYLESPRHVEVQVLADAHGNTIHLFERECSVQRRHQKVVEEAPSPAVDPALRDELGVAAIAAARAVGYRGAGTVEFLLAGDGEFFFLEMNTRLQVEHPVTEAVTGLDLVRLQLLVARGEALPPAALRATIRGHAIEARLYAEDPTRDYVPTTGTVDRFRTPDLPGLRVDSAIEDGSTVGVHYDPMLAKVVAHAATRDEAAALLARALDETQVHGVATNQALLAAILRHADFRSGATDTGFLDRHPPADLLAPVDPGADDARRRVHTVAAVLALQARRRAGTPVLGSLPGGWRNNPSQLEHVALEERGGAGDPRRVEVGFRVTPETVVEIDGVPAGELTVERCGPDLVDVVVDGVRHRCGVHQVGDVVHVDGRGPGSTFRVLPRFPAPDTSGAGSGPERGSLVAPMPGTVVRTPVAEGDHVEAGEVLVVVEAMKMEHTVAAPHAGVVVSVPVAVGQVVDVGTVLAVVSGDEGTAP